MSFSQQAARQAYEYAELICRHCPQCQSTCHIHIAKDTLSYMAQTGSKFFEGFPDTILPMIRSLPLTGKFINKPKIAEVYDIVQLTCDNCPLDEHKEHCAINVVLTALGTLLYGPNFLTERDIQTHS